MMRVKRLQWLSTPRNFCARRWDDRTLTRIPSQFTSRRFLDIHQLMSKDAIQKERARLNDEMSRGYFADMSEMKVHGGKIASANKIIVPAAAAVKFPTFEVNYSNGATAKLPVTSDMKGSEGPKASLLSLSFRATSQPMAESWISPFIKTFGHSTDVCLYEVSFIDSWLLTRSPIKKLLLKIMRKPQPAESNDIMQKHIVYAFGDHYYLRKELKILNLLTSYIFLLDDHGRVRWQGFGSATQDELLSLFSCTAILLQEKQ